MNADDRSRMEHADQVLTKGKAALSTDPKNALYWITSGLKLRATTLLRNDDPRTSDAINELVETVARLRHESSHHISLYEKNDLVFLALFAKNRTGAVKLASLTTYESDPHPFAHAIHNYLAAALALPSTAIADIKVTATERGFLADLRAVASRAPTDFSGTDRFWSALRRKRFANTIFEYKNIFRGALEFLHGS